MKKANALRSDALWVLCKASLLLLVLLALFLFIFGLHRVSEADMQPTFQDGDLLLYVRMTGSLHSFDVVVLETAEGMSVRRVIGEAGDLIDLTQDGLTRNGILISDEWTGEGTYAYEEGVSFPLTVPDGCLFVLGDNRSGAKDSRIYGCMEKSCVCGKVILLLRRRNL